MAKPRKKEVHPAPATPEQLKTLGSMANIPQQRLRELRLSRGEATLWINSITTDSQAKKGLLKLL